MPGANEVAFYSPLYYKRNFQIGAGGSRSSSPEGFFIVAWKDGRVTQVPWSDVRYCAYAGSETQVGYAFPGMSLWREDDPHLQ